MTCSKYDTCKNRTRCSTCVSMSDIYNNYPLYERSRIFKLNLNDPVKVKLTDLGKDIYYHSVDGLIDKGIKIERRYPTVDENGFSEFQLWSFIQLYGPYVGMAMPNVIEDISLYISERDLWIHDLEVEK